MPFSPGTRAQDNAWYILPSTSESNLLTAQLVRRLEERMASADLCGHTTLSVLLRARLVPCMTGVLELDLSTSRHPGQRQSIVLLYVAGLNWARGCSF
jgi:hypothetical protein